MKSHPVFNKQRIFAPGPTPVPTEVLSVLSLPPLHHRTKEFISILERTKENLKFLFQTKEPVHLLSASGTGAMETAIVNCFSEGEEVLCINAGKFGERWVKIAKAFNLKIHTLEIEWGNSVSPVEIVKTLKENPKISGVFVQACETSTGIEHPIAEISKALREFPNTLFIVDAITGLGVIDLPMDAWGIDILIGGSQKALMLPPGLAFLSLSKAAQEKRLTAGRPRFYFDLNSEDKAAQKGETAWTPAVSLIMGLDLVLQEMKNAGLKPIFSFHSKIAEATRRGVLAMGCELFNAAAPATAVTAINVPASVDGKKIVGYLRDRFGITIAGGQDHLKGKIFRIGHLGFYDELDVLTILSATELTLSHLGHSLELGRGVGAASAFFLENSK